MLDFFIQLEEQESTKNQSCELAWQKWDREAAKRRVICPHCKEDAGTWGIAELNHSIVFNGWCSKRLFITLRSESRQTKQAVIDKVAANKWDVEQIWKLAQQDLAWLADRGFEIVDPYDEANYDRALYAIAKLGEYRNYYWSLAYGDSSPPCTGHDHARVFTDVVK